MPYYCNRYRCALLLAWAAIALVINPVWHVAGHCFSDHHHDEAVEHTGDIQWTKDDLCPYCDAVTQFVGVPVTVESKVALIRLEDFFLVYALYSDHRFRISTRLRAPPIL